MFQKRSGFVHLPVLCFYVVKLCFNEIMKIALIGYGAMGKLIGRLAVERLHEIGLVVDEGDAGLSAAELAEKLKGCDAAIDLSSAEAVRRNVEACVLAGVPLAEGTTGWAGGPRRNRSVCQRKKRRVRLRCKFFDRREFVYKITNFAAELFAKFEDYEAFIEEQHHSRKVDAPSGTALKLKDVVAKHIEKDFSVSTRAGRIPGTHRVGFDGVADQILLEHFARSREGFASGAILAAEWIVGKKVYSNSATLSMKLFELVGPMRDLRCR